MLKKKDLTRPDRQFEKMLVSLVYAVIALATSILLLFIFPHHSFLFLSLTLVITSVVISIAIILVSDSERALTYGGFANLILESNTLISRIDNADFDVVIQNKPAVQFFKQDDILPFLKHHLFADTQNKLNLECLEQAVQNLKSENVILELCFEKETRFFNVSVQPIYLKKNDIFQSEFSIAKIQKETYFLWRLEDITAAQNMEKIMEQERQKLHLFIQNMPLGLYVLNQEGCIEYANDTFASILNLEKQDILNHPLTDFVSNTNSPLFDANLIEFSGLVFFKTPQENLELFITQNRYKESNRLKARGLVLKNIPTDESLLALSNKLQNEYNLLFQYNPMAVLHVLSNGVINACNPQAVKLFNNNLENAHLSDFFEKTDLKRLEHIYNEYQNRKNFTKLTEFETTLNFGKPVSVAVAPHYLDYNKTPSLNGLILFINDTTKNKTLEHQFSQAQKMQAMGQFAGGVAHDFNNLLTAMIGYCDLLLQRHRIGDPSFADLTEIKRSAVRAAALVHQLLVYSKQQPSNPKLLDVVESLSDLNGFLKRILGEQIKLEITHAPDLGYIYIDPVNFTQVIMNLSINAKDAMNLKGILKINTHIETLIENTSFGDDIVAAGDYIVISVTDTGCGIKKENLSRIFDPFFSTKQNVVGSGTGLGLATVYGIVSKSKGLIKVESQEGRGTTFKIYFPRVLKTPETPAPKKQKSETIIPVLTDVSGEAPKLIFGLNVNKTDKKASLQDTSKINILFVEDESSVRAFGVRALKKKGFNVVGAGSGENALEQEGSFDLLITDMVMPGMSGTELATLIKQRQPNIKIIIASGYSEEMAIKELSGNEDFTFLAKPYSLGDLTQKVFEVLNG
ncbi:MAG: response regulator [Alphaproteobacteria bacterium]|nr:response regulator [Alphaproteobacteria bacterium]